ncbi:hypothetical protein GF345_00985 [Candidatus Woesearchaeota archaeon]|nr:hypothetical protein [Candidatus Woesearchaeota archaeon]
MVILILFFGIISSMSNPRRGKLSKDAELITKALTGEGDSAIVKDNRVEQSKIEEFAIDSDQYEALKQQLGVQGDFCIYFEDNEGNLVPVHVSEDANGNPMLVNGLGSDGAIINDHPCGAQYNPND